MSKAKPLYLEQRIGIVRKALNEKSLRYMDIIDLQGRNPKAYTEFKQYILDMMSVLDGDYFGDARKRLKKED